MGVILIIIAIVFIMRRQDKKKKHSKRMLWGKSDWEKTCDDGGKFFRLVNLLYIILYIYFVVKSSTYFLCRQK